MRRASRGDPLPWFAIADRVCIDATDLGIGWADDAQDKFGPTASGRDFHRRSKGLACRSRRDGDRRSCVSDDPQIRADLRKCRKVTTAASNIAYRGEAPPTYA